MGRLFPRGAVAAEGLRGFVQLGELGVDVDPAELALGKVGVGLDGEALVVDGGEAPLERALDGQEPGVVQATLEAREVLVIEVGEQITRELALIPLAQALDLGGRFAMGLTLATQGVELLGEAKKALVERR